MYSRHPMHVVKKRPEKKLQWERLQMYRLICAFLLFLTVFLGKRIYPEKVLQVGEEVVAVLGETTDFKTVFSQLGESLSSAEQTISGIEQFCIEVFGAQESPQKQAAAQLPVLPDISSGLAYNQTRRTVVHTILLSQSADCAETEPEAVVPAVGTILTIGDSSGPALPEGYTVDELSFGTLETVNPVLGQLNSGFGYRDHPVNGKHCFHGGADISANAGDPIAAFADGQVEYVGEDASYGIYLQLDHGNGIKSFYAHCQSLCVNKGDQIRAGETIALVGSTGRTTGPHLHLELKCGGLRVDPAYYIDFLSAA